MLSRSLRQFQVAALGIVLLTSATRLPSLLYPQPIKDEEVYSVVANEIVDGGRLYIDAVDRKPPLLFWTYAAVFELTGKFNWKALHVVALLWVLATMAGLYVIGNQLSDRKAGLIAALLYSIFQPWATFTNLAFNGELLMNLPIVWAWAIGFRRSSSRLRLELLSSGALLCVAFLLKQPAAIAAIPLGIYLLLPSYRASRGLARINSVTHAAMLVAGFFGTLGLVVIVLHKQGILRDTFYWTITNNAVPYVFWEVGVLITLAFVGTCLPLIIGAVMAFGDSNGVWAGKSAERTALIGLLAASAIGAASGARFYHHYYIQLIPPLALLAAPHYARLWFRRGQPRYWLLRPPIMYAWLTITVVGFSTEHWIGFASRREPSEAGRYLLEHSTPQDRIFVWGFGGKIYLDSRRRPACRYVLTFPLTGHVFGGLATGFHPRTRAVPGAWATLEQDFRRHPPVYIVDIDARYPINDFPVLARLLAEHYEPVARTAEGVIYEMR